MKTEQQILREHSLALTEKRRLVDESLRYRELIKTAEFGSPSYHEWIYQEKFFHDQAMLVDGVIKTLTWVLRNREDKIIQPPR